MSNLKTLEAIGCCLLVIIVGISIVSVMPYQIKGDEYASFTNPIPLIGWACILLGSIGIPVSIKWIK